MKAGGAAAKTAAAALQAAAAEGKMKQREKRLQEALVELRQSLTAAAAPPSAAAAAGAGAIVPRSVIEAVVHACLLGESVAADAGAALITPSAPIRVLAFQTLLSIGPALRAHVTASAPLRASLLRAIFATLNDSSSGGDGVDGGGAEASDEAFMDEELSVLALRTLLRAATDGHLVALVRDPLLLSPLRATLAPPPDAGIPNPARRQQRRRRAAMLLLVGRELLPRLLRDGGLDATPLGQVLPPFSSAHDALRFRQEARDAVMDLAKAIVEACEAPESPAADGGDGGGGVSAAAFLALDALLAEGGPRMLAAEVAALVDAPTPPFPSATAQEVALSLVRHCLARLPRLLLRFSMGRRRSVGGLAGLSRLLEFVLLEHTNASGMLLAPPPRTDRTSVVPPVSSAAVYWAHAYEQITEEWVQRHLLPAALEGTDPQEAWVAISWTLELLHLPALRHWREALAPPCLERLLGLYPLHPPSTPTGLLLLSDALDAEEGGGGFGGAKAAFHRAQAALAALCCVALKWCPLPTLDRLVPRILQLLACLGDATARASLLGETLLLCLCNGQRNGRLLLLRDEAIVQRCFLLPPSSPSSEGEAGGHEDEEEAAATVPPAFRTEVYTALLSLHLRLCPLVFPPTAAQQQPFPPLARLTTAAARARLSGRVAGGDGSSGDSDCSNALRWLRLTLLLLRRLSGVTSLPPSPPPRPPGIVAVAPLAAYISLLACACRLLLPRGSTATAEPPPPPPASSSLPPTERAEMAEHLRGVLVNLLQFRLPEGVPDASQRLRLLRLLAQYAGSIGPEPTLREQMAMDVAHFLATELPDGQTSSPPVAPASSALEGTLGGGQTRDFPTRRTRALRALEGAVWRARGAMDGLVQLAVSLARECPGVPPRVVSLLKAALAGVEQQLEGDSSSSSLSALACYREEIALALRRVEAAVGGGASESALLSCLASSHRLFPPTIDDDVGPSLLLSPNDPAYTTAINAHSAWIRRFEHRLLLLPRTPTTAALSGAPAASLPGDGCPWEDLGAVFPFALTGGSDPIHLTAEATVSTRPSSSFVRVRVKAFNATNCRIDGLRLHLRLLDPHLATLSPHSAAAAAALCEGEGAGPLPPGAAFEVDFLLRVHGDGAVRLAWDIGFPQLDAPVAGDGAQARATEALWARLLRAEEGAAGAVSAGGEEQRPPSSSSSASLASRFGRASSLGKSSQHQSAPRSKHHHFPPPPPVKGTRRTVWCRSATLTVPFSQLLLPPPEAEVVIGGGFQALWAALPYGQARPVESDATLVRELLTWWVQRRRQEPQQPQDAISPAAAVGASSAPFSSSSSDTLDVHALMALVPRASRRHELLPDAAWRGLTSRLLREKGRVRSAAGIGGGRFFSDAWVFRTVTGRIVAAVLIGVGPPGVSPTAAAASLGEGEEGEGSVPCWRGRLEVRCDDEGVLRRHLIGADGDGDGSLRRFLSFLTHDVFVPSAGAGDAAGLAAGVLVPSHASLSGGSIGSSQPPSLLAAAAAGAPPLSLSFLAPTRTGSLATAATAAAAARASHRVYGSGPGLLGLSTPGRGVVGPAGPVLDVFLPSMQEGCVDAPNGGVGASLGPAAVAAQARGVAEGRRRREAGGLW